MKNHRFSISIDATNSNKEAQNNIEFTTGDIIHLDPILVDENSRFLKSIFTYNPSSKVCLSINDQTVKPIKRRKDRLVAYLPPEKFLMQDLTVIENVQLWFPDTKDQDKILFEPLLQPIIHTLTGRLSGGELRFLEFLLVINLPHLLILLDQPFNSLALLTIERCEEILIEISPEKAIIINEPRFSDHTNNIKIAV